MEPGPRGPGDWGGQFPGLSLRASMEPGPRGPGDTQAVGVGDGQGGVASMEPGPRGPGDPATATLESRAGPPPT